VGKTALAARHLKIKRRIKAG